MKAKYKKAGLWLSVGTAAIGAVAVLAGLSKEQTDALTTLLGAAVTVSVALGYLRAESAVRVAKIKALAQLHLAKATADIDPLTARAATTAFSAAFSTIEDA